MKHRNCFNHDVCLWEHVSLALKQKVLHYSVSNAHCEASTEMYNCGIPYSQKYWRSIKFGSLAVGEATVKFKSVKFNVRSTYIRIILRVRVRAYYMYGTTAKFKSANIFISAARDQTAKFKDRQYFYFGRSGPNRQI